MIFADTENLNAAPLLTSHTLPWARSTSGGRAGVGNGTSPQAFASCRKPEDWSLPPTRLRIPLPPPSRMSGSGLGFILQSGEFFPPIYPKTVPGLSWRFTWCGGGDGVGSGGDGA